MLSVSGIFFEAWFSERDGAYNPITRQLVAAAMRETAQKAL